MSPTPNLLALTDEVIINLAYLAFAASTGGKLFLHFSNTAGMQEHNDPEGKMFARLRERAWPLLEKP